MMADGAPQKIDLQNWLYILFSAAPVAILTIAGAISLGRGVWGTFDLKQAVFGASLLVAGALVEMFVWIVKRRSGEQEVERAYALRWQAMQKCDEVLRLLQTPQNRTIIEVMKLLEGRNETVVQQPETLE